MAFLTIEPLLPQPTLPQTTSVQVAAVAGMTAASKVMTAGAAPQSAKSQLGNDRKHRGRDVDRETAAAEMRGRGTLNDIFV